MKTLMFVVMAFGLATSAMADEITISFNGGALTCNWGQLTSESIAAGFEQGPHASDPSGDGYGPGDSDQPRVGLANVVDKGDLEATCNFIRDQLGL
jgi:hypothetical protein